MSEPYRLFVRDLVLDANLGIYDDERDGPQRVCINLDVRAHRVHGGADISSVVSYEKFVRAATEVIAEGHFDLVETLAERIAERCLEDPRVVDVVVRVEKPDIVPEAAGVGVEIHRHRS